MEKNVGYNEFLSKSLNDLYFMCFDKIEKIYKKFGVFDFDKEEIEEVILKGLEVTKNSVNENNYQDFSDIFYYKASRKMKECVNKKFSSTYLAGVINNKINSSLSMPNDKKSSYIVLSFVLNFLDETGIEFSPSLVIFLINNNEIINNSVKNIVFANLNNIKNDRFTGMIANDNIRTFIEIYCSINHIDLNDDFSSDAKTVDGLGDYLKSLPEHYAYEDEKELAMRVKAGDLEAKNIFIESNLKLVVSIAKFYVNRGLHLDDLIQEGNLGLIRAVDLYDPTLGFKFSTYATWWIKQAITRAIHDKAKNIRIPVHAQEALGRIKSIKVNFENKYYREPTLSELSKLSGIEESKLNSFLANCADTMSLNEIVTVNEESEVGDLVADKRVDIESEVLDEEMKHFVRKVLEESHLTDKEKEVIKYRFGFYGRVYTLEEVGKIYGITRERIRQIEVKALRKLRRPYYTNLLSESDKPMVKTF